VARRRLVAFLGIFSGLAILLMIGSALLVEQNLLRVRGHVTIGWAAAAAFVLYLILSMPYIVRVQDSDE
jgi:hypothetical protein